MCPGKIQKITIAKNCQKLPKVTKRYQKLPCWFLQKGNSFPSKLPKTEPLERLSLVAGVQWLRRRGHHRGEVQGPRSLLPSRMPRLPKDTKRHQKTPCWFPPKSHCNCMNLDPGGGIHVYSLLPILIHALGLGLV